MRVTNSMLVTNFMNDLNGNLNRLSKLQSQMASGRKFANMSDDPVSLLYSLQARNRIGTLKQYRRNVSDARAWTEQGETVVMELNDLVKSAYETVIDATTDGKTAADRQNIAEYIRQLRDQVISAANVTMGDKYLFGSYNTTGSDQTPPNGLRPPVWTEDVYEERQVIDENGNPVVDGSGNPVMESVYVGQKITFNGLDMVDIYQTDPVTGERLTDADGNYIIDPLKKQALEEEAAQKLSFTVGTNLDMDVTTTAVDLLGIGDDNLCKILDDLYNLLSSGDSDAMDIVKGTYIEKLQNKQNDLLALAAEYGGKTNRFDMIASRYELDNLTYTQMKQDAEDADLAEVIMNHSMAESVYNAALAAGSQIIQKTLMDFLV